MNEDLNEEIFCLKFELIALAELTLKGDAERWIPGFIYQTTEHDHIERYKLAGDFVKGKEVLDIASGVGKGSNYLANIGKATHVLGCDINEDAVRYAKHRNKHPSVLFEVQDAEKFRCQDRFDVAISFETIEHLKNYSLFIRNISASLKENGLFIVSSPISHKPYDDKPSNPYHVQEWGFTAFHDLLSECFDIQKVYVQLYSKQIAAPSILKRTVKYIKRKINPISSTRSILVDKYSKLEEYNSQYPIADMGTTRAGFQIVIAKRK